MKGKAINWLPEELAWIEARKEWPRAELHRAFVNFWKRPEITIGAFKGLCKRKGWLTGRTGQFSAGQSPHNLGQPMAEHPNSVAHRFKPGAVPPNRVPLGTERIVAGYTEIKVDERNPHTGHSTRFVQKHRWLWEKVNGPLPIGHCLKSLDGNKLNTEPSNWIAIPRALLPRLNGKSGRNYDNAPRELQPAILAIAKVEHAARERLKAAKQTPTP